ncbi:hypothetical protein G9C85_04670 [Halorubellus sp. JP-L1]|uniref:ComEC/Rec2 family competence protein n=1 Tax=Halorubellus sp. JP-L1 TaxID=2715753 RepID=UPI00140B0D02|nr:MBL fold metallo-hydrolase [Halorubellus sp. JP-L1]NHN40929.1 hypothetical protein [Halorubellus sp. JP-L1]
MSKRRRNTITIASDDSARVPFAIIGVLLLVSSVAVVAVKQTQPESTAEQSTSTAEALRQTEALSRTAVQSAAKQALKKAARKPVTEPSDGPAGEAFDAGSAGMDDDSYEYDRHVFRRYVKLRIYLAVQEQLASTGQTFQGDVRTVSSTPDVSYSQEELEAAIDRVELTAGIESDEDDVETGEVEVTVEDVSVTAIREDGTKDTRTREISLTVPSTAFALHNRTVKYEKRLDMGFFEADGMNGFGRQFAARIYPLAYAKAYYERVNKESTFAPVKDAEADFPSMVENYEAEIFANDAVYGVQKNVFGTSDEGARNAMAGAWTCLFARTGGKLFDLKKKMKDRYVESSPKDLCRATQFIVGGPSGERKSLTELLDEIGGGGMAGEARDQLNKQTTVHIRNFSNPSYNWVLSRSYEWKQNDQDWSEDGAGDSQEPPNSDKDAVSGDNEMEMPDSNFETDVLDNIIDRTYEVDIGSDVRTSSSGSENPTVTTPSFEDSENWSVDSDNKVRTDKSISVEKRSRMDGSADSSWQDLHTVAVTVEKSYKRTKVWEYDGPEDLGPTETRESTSSVTYEVEVTTKANHSERSIIADKGVSNIYEGGPSDADGRPPRYFDDVPERALTTVLSVGGASSVESELEDISPEDVHGEGALRSKVVNDDDKIVLGPSELFEDGERGEVRDWLRAEITETNDRVNSSTADWATMEVSRMDMATDDDVFSTLKQRLRDRRDAIVYRDSRTGYDTITEKARAELRLVYVRQMRRWMDEVESRRNDARGNVNQNLSDSVEGTENALTDGLQFANGALEDAPDLVGTSPPGEIGNSDVYDDVTFRVETAPSYLSLSPVTRNTVPEVRPRGETVSDPENTFHASMAARNNALLPNPGAPVVPWPSFWYVSVNNVNVRVNGEYARFAASARTGGPSAESATTYVRQPQPVHLEINGLRHRVGRVEAVNFSSMTSVVLATPGGTVMPYGSLGAGDRVSEKPGATKHELTECSVTWPYVGPGFSPEKQDPSKCANIPNDGGTTASNEELLIGALSGDGDDMIDLAFGDDDDFETSACDLPDEDDDNKVRASVNVAGDAGKHVFSDVEQVRVRPADDDDEDETDGCPDEHFDVTFIDLGKGDSVLFEYQSKDGETETMLVDAGANAPARYEDDLSNTLAAEMDGEDHTIDHLVVSHNHSDHLNLIDDLLEDEENDFDIENVHFSGSSTGSGTEADIAEALDGEASTEILRAGDSIRFGDATARVLRPEGTGDVDEKSVVMKVIYEDFTVLTTGDIRQDQEQALVEEQYLADVDVLQASHHGTSAEGETVVSEELLAATTPKSIVISNSNRRRRNQEFAPDCGVFDRAEVADIPVYWTAVHEDVTFVTGVFGPVVGPMDGETAPSALRERLPYPCGDDEEAIYLVQDQHQVVWPSRVKYADRGTHSGVA